MYKEVKLIPTSDIIVLKTSKNTLTKVYKVEVSQIL